MEPDSQSSGLKGDVDNNNGATGNFFYDSPIHSELETKLKKLLLKLMSDKKILGIQVCAYKDGEVVVDAVAGVLGPDDRRPVQHDSLFPCFSVTKGIVAGMVHWLVDKGKLKLDENVANVWPGFGINKKEMIKVHHVLNHTSGLHNAMPCLFDGSTSHSVWKECLDDTAASIPETEPGKEQMYHYSSYGWLCGGIIEHASGMKFQEVIDQAIIRPLNLEGECYIGIPPGVESRLASLVPDMKEFKLMLIARAGYRPELPSTYQPSKIVETIKMYADLACSLEVRQAIVPAANGHFSARAIARYYATLVTGGIVPPSYSQHRTYEKEDGVNRIFHNPKIHDAFLGVGDYKDLALPNHEFGLGFKRFNTKDEINTGFGHTGLGGSVGFCDIKHKFSIAVTVNKLSLGYVTASVVHLVCSELDIPVPEDYEDLLKVNDL